MSRLRMSTGRLAPRPAVGAAAVAACVAGAFSRAHHTAPVTHTGTGQMCIVRHVGLLLQEQHMWFNRYIHIWCVASRLHKLGADVCGNIGASGAFPVRRKCLPKVSLL